MAKIRNILICLLSLLLLTLCACAGSPSAQLQIALDQSQAKCTDLALELSQYQKDLAAQQAAVKQLQAQVDSLSAELEELNAPPPLTENRTISFLGVPVTVYSDGETDYLPAEALPVQPPNVEAREENGASYVPLNETVESLGLRRGMSPSGTGYTAKEVWLSPVTPSVDVPILMYHAVSDDCWGYEELFVSPANMEAQLQYLTENGFDPIWFEDLSHLSDYDKPVLLTFDDGYDDNYTELFPLLEQYNVKATIFVIGNAMGTAHKMTADQVRELSQSGLVSIQSHTQTHRKLGTLSDAEQLTEMTQSKDAIAAITGQVPYVLCYPEGSYNAKTLELAAQHYAFGLKMNGNLYNTDHGAYEINRFYVSRYTDINQFISMCGQTET